jgi:hypothetical protein
VRRVADLTTVAERIETIELCGHLHCGYDHEARDDAETVLTEALSWPSLPDA